MHDKAGMPLRQNLRYWLPAAFWLGLIFLMSTDTFSSENTSLMIEPMLRFLMPGISTQAVEAVHGLIRKCAHVTEYFILGIFLFRAFHLSSKKERLWMSALFSMAIVMLYAATDEFHQSFVPSRTASVIDVGMDSFGGAMAQIASVLWWKRKKAEANRD